MAKLPSCTRAFLVGSLCVLLLLAAGLYAWLLADLPPISQVAIHLARPTTEILDRNGHLLYEVLDPDVGKQIELNLDEIPKTCIQATLATEDSRFYYHPGVDPLAIVRALWQNARAGGQVVSGGSTLTQQLARSLLLPPNERYVQTVSRKLREAWLAWRLERVYSKDQLLALYLNQTYYGNFAVGLEAAAQVFFAKPAAQLSRGECALLAGLVQYPSGYNPLSNPGAAKDRQLTVLRLMRQSGFVTSAEADQVAAEPLRYRSRLFDIEAPHFVMYVQDLLVRRLGADRLRRGGLRITTTLDLGLQLQAEESVRYRLDLLNCRKPGLCDEYTDPNRRAGNAAAVILDNHTGEILSMVGSPDYFDPAIQGNVNAALSLRQPGSAIKPFTYAAALDPTINAELGLEPLTPASIIADLPTTFYVRDEQGGNVPYQPVNYDRLYHGPVSVRTALASSYNIPAVKTLDRIGIPTLQRVAQEAGIGSLAGEYGLALTLGGGEVSLLELTKAYGAFLTGARLDSTAILRVEERAPDGSWRTLPGFSSRPTRQAAAPQIFDPATVYLITDILADPFARIPSFGRDSVLELPFPAAVKTGTTTDWRDNWTMGYSAERVVGVWVGNADNSPMLDVSGIDGAGPIWRDLMLAAHRSPPAGFTRPSNVTERVICAPSGLLPTSLCPSTRSERFIRGHEPLQADNQFQAVTVDLRTGLAADDATPAAFRAERAYWVLPAEYKAWMINEGIPLLPPALEHEETAPNRPQDQLASVTVQPLVLDAPTSNTAYAIHPRVPRDHQRIEVNGYDTGGRTWARLRLLHNGETIAAAADSDRLHTWWTLAPGAHNFWVEGEQDPDSPTVRSALALVIVEAAPEPPAGEAITVAAP